MAKRIVELDEKRISSLEAELKILRSALIELRDLVFYEGGKQRMFEYAVLSLIGTHHAPDTLTPILSSHLDQLEANIVSSSQSEAHLKGAQDAAEILRAAVRMLQEP